MSDRNGYGAGSIYPRGNTWWIQYYFRGKRYKESAESSRKADANALLKRRIAEMEAGKHIGRSEKDLTVPDLMDRYVADMELRGCVTVGSVKSQIIPIKASAASRG